MDNKKSAALYIKEKNIIEKVRKNENQEIEIQKQITIRINK